MPQMNNFGGACLSPLAALIKFSKYIYRTIYRGTVDFLGITATATFCSNANHNLLPLDTISMPSVNQDRFFFSSRTPTYHFIRCSCHLYALSLSLSLLPKGDRLNPFRISNFLNLLPALVLLMFPTFKLSPD